MKNFILLLLLLTAASCSSYLRTTAAKMISPEANGGFFRGTVDVRFENVQAYQLDFKNSTTQKLDDIGEFGAINLYADLGILSRLDLYLHPDILLTPPVFGLKYQILGEPRRFAKQGNFSLSLAAGIGQRSDSKSSNLDDFDAFDGSIKEIDLDQSHTEFGLIVGYRWTNWLLHYGNIFLMKEEAKGTVTNDSGSIVDKDFKYKNSSTLASTGFMIYFAEHFHLKLDYTYLVTDWDYTAAQTSHVMNGGIGFHW